MQNHPSSRGLLTGDVSPATASMAMLNDENSRAVHVITALPDELIQYVCKQGSAQTLAALCAVCRKTCLALTNAMTSKDASGHWDEMWLDFCMADFPRLKGLLRLTGVPTCSFRELYERQLVASRPPTQPRLALGDFIFTAELKRGDETLLASWSGTLVGEMLHAPMPLTFEDGAASRWFDEARREALAMPRDGNYGARMLCAARVFVWATRKKDLATVCLYRGGAFDAFRFIDERDASRHHPSRMHLPFAPSSDGRPHEPLRITPLVQPEERTVALHFARHVVGGGGNSPAARAVTAPELLKSLEARDWVA